MFLGETLVVSMHTMVVHWSENSFQAFTTESMHHFFIETVFTSRVMRKTTFWFPTRPHTNQAVQPHKMDRGLKFRIIGSRGIALSMQ